jgi:CorA-like Mg2+ transporter protein.
MIIGSFFGMNVPVPWTDFRWAFLGILGIAAVASGAAMVLLYKKNLF